MLFHAKQSCSVLYILEYIAASPLIKKLKGPEKTYMELESKILSGLRGRRKFRGGIPPEGDAPGFENLDSLTHLNTHFGSFTPLPQFNLVSLKKMHV